VPVNFPGVFWRPLIENAHPDRSPDPAQISLTRAGDPDTRLPFLATRTGSSDFLLVPDSALTVGETYVATDPTVCEAYGPSGSQAAHIQFVVGPSAPMPTTLGTLAASDPGVGQRSVPGAFSPCDVEVTAAWQTVQLTMTVASATATIQLDCDATGGGGSSTGGPDTGDPGSAGGAGCNAGGPGSSAWLGLALGAVLLRRARR
jgi:uncharacterized protein (TIGR03382 family)